MSVRLAIVVPCYNEEQVLHETARRLGKMLATLSDRNLISNDSSIYLVDDGSKDLTWQIIEGLTVDSRIRGIKLSRNSGHQNALLAGLFGAEGDVVVTVDADLQDDLAVIETMVSQYRNGSEIVYGVRKNRSSDTLFKRGTASLFYCVMARIGVDLIYNHADFRLMSRRAIDALRGYEEVNLFLRGVIPLLGFSTSTVYYDRTKRFAGESKYPIWRMLALAIDGVTSFSVTPLRLISAAGIMVWLLSMAMIAWVLYGHYFHGAAVPGWASSVIPIYFLGGIQLFSIGVLGEYVAKIYMETKRRPRYFIEKVTGSNTEARSVGA